MDFHNECSGLCLEIVEAIDFQGYNLKRIWKKGFENMNNDASNHMTRVMDRLNMMNKSASLGGGHARIEAQHQKGKKTARERINALLDGESFVELDKFVLSRAEENGNPGEKHYGDGVVTGYGTIDGRPVFVFAHDFTVFGGSLGEMFGRKINKVMDLSMKAGAPIIGLSDSGGARIQEGVQSLAAYSEIFFRNTLASGVIPQLSAILGPCAGGAVYSPAMTDFVFMVEKTSLHVHHRPRCRPGSARAGSNFRAGSEVQSGMLRRAVSAHFVSQDEDECFEGIRKLLSFLPSNNSEFPPAVNASDSPSRSNDILDTIIPQDSSKPYDMKSVIAEIVDDYDFLEVHSHWASNIIIAFARMDGKTVGIVANQPMQLSRGVGHRFVKQGCPVHQILRLVQHSRNHLGRRTWLHAGNRAGIGWYNQAWVEVAVRLLRGDCAENNGCHKESIWWGLLRHGQQVFEGRSQFRVAIRTTGGDGPRGGGENSSSEELRI